MQRMTAAPSPAERRTHDHDKVKYEPVELHISTHLSIKQTTECELKVEEITKVTVKLCSCLFPHTFDVMSSD